MYKYLTQSDSLIGSLCREIEYIRQRYKNVSISHSISKDTLLRERLLDEILNLKQRRMELIEISYEFNHSYQTSLSALFFYELCQRPLEIKI